jgi:predicted TIM-barrel fold metal-dependent hydrolase
MRETRCPVFDADSHLLEPASIWQEYLEPRLREAARSAFCLAPAGGVVLNGERAPELAHPHLPRYAIWRPGMSEDDVGALDLRFAHAPNPGACEPAARLRDMDAMGIDQALLLPTLFNEYHPLVKDVEVAAGLATAYNRWARDFAAAAPERLYPAAVLPLQDAERAIAELRRVAGQGFRAALIRPVFSNGRFPSDPHFDGLWRELEAQGIAAVVHPSPGLAAPELDANAPFIERVGRVADAGHPIAEFLAPAMDNAAFLVAILADGLLERIPRLRLLFAHSGVAWLPLALEKTETYLWLSHQERPVSLAPEELFQSRTCAVSFRAGDGSVRRMAAEFAPIAAFGSRYPNHDSGDAWQALEDLEAGGVPPALIERLMGANAARVLGLTRAEAS